MISYQLKHICKQSKARYGILRTPNGVYETPLFMPVGTKATVKTLTPEDVAEVSDGLILANTYHLWLQPGTDVIKAHGGVKNFMNWKGSLLTDSGGFQVFSLASFREIKEEGVHFKNPVNGDMLFLSPEKAIKIQEILGADIMMSFDECPPIDASYQYLKESVERTLRWAKRGKDALSTEQALFGIVQGGLDESLRKHSALETVKIGFPGYAIGGLSVGEEKQDMYQTINFTTPFLPADKPRYLMGVGDPVDIFEAVIRGVDMFDCVLPTRNARHGTVFTTEGKINIKNKKYQFDLTAIDNNINNKISPYTKAYIRHLFKANEILGAQLMSYQNLAFLNHLMKSIRTAIKEDRLLDFKDEFLKKYQRK
ncbi:MAG: tRNA guanosine(34) transglycosylase Tgt [Acholeplasmatales bacterium]|jgi:queuine tRNA-ribosyltransferase|nr:tRNA guanosine(34) transglycosylase Tgt [Acholeplasmataceae bacterium]MCK9289211.1 tRNA guanosine(34) transglycosylase Tgt [Acholeplasmataceae bacterium]MCK9427683.1 tRNA guanosine(34) transglycosylase Tgt [Acholeplasmataceae bacterium]MDY0115276.1 tRNA guanosine(34) transglycosylase Tgt [Acholeplasmatales bacterium]